jgi:nucleotide-binding universal stress UspA family protein
LPLRRAVWFNGASDDCSTRKAMNAFRAVLATVSGSKSDRTVLQAASLLTEETGRITALCVREDPLRGLPIMAEGAMAAAQVVTVLEEQATARVARAREKFEHWSNAVPKLQSNFQESLGPPVEAIASWGRTADLIVTARPSDGDIPLITAVVEACLFESGCPVVVVPNQTMLNASGTIAILWDGSRTAARAVRDSLSVLDGANEVVIFTAGDLKHSGPLPDALVRRLSARGVDATASSVMAKDDTGTALLEAATNAGAHLVVMGAYGHSRMRELILGGVTRHMLHASPIPLFMAH